MAWIFVVRPKASGQSLAPQAPCPPAAEQCAGGRAVDGLTIAGISVSERFKHVAKSPASSAVGTVQIVVGGS